MKRRMSFRAKVLWTAFGINALCMLVYTVDTCLQERATYIDGVDKKLRSTAFALPFILPEGFHDSISGPESISEELDWEIFTTNSRYALDADVKYVYTYMRRGDSFYECASSGDPEDLERREKEPFFARYEQAPRSIYRAWDTDEIQYDEYSDEFGHFRSAFIPMRTAAGTRFVAGADVELATLDEALLRIVGRSVLLGLGIFVVVACASLLVLRRTLQPVTELTAHTRSLVEQDFVVTERARAGLQAIAERENDEFGQLAHGFVDMAGRLEEYIDQLKRTTAAKERFESELRIAHDIQMSFLKKVFPPFPDRPEFDLAAALEPAKEVGGDLYDFFFLDDSRLLFYVGDVSDKGVPASLFMAVTITLMKRVAQERGGDPARILAKVNDALAEDNENLMFVTLFCAILDVRTGEMIVANAGHNPPLLLRDGGSEWLEAAPGPALGVMPGAGFTCMRTRLHKGDTIICYTDGVTEAMNVDGDQFTPERLESLCPELRGLSEPQMVKRIIGRVHTHAGSARQSDDITVLALNHRGAAAQRGGRIEG